MEYLLDEGWFDRHKNRMEERMPNFKHCKLKTIWVPPEKALKFFGHVFSGGTPVKNAGIRDVSVKNITEGLKQGVKLPPLLHFTVPGGYVTPGGKRQPMVNEGRNRAFVSWHLGIEKIPVVVDA